MRVFPKKSIISEEILRTHKRVKTQGTIADENDNKDPVS